jgi:hypothetical protein
LPGCRANNDASTPLSGSKIGKGTNPPDFTYFAYWSIVPGPVQFIRPFEVEFRALRFCERVVELMAVVRPDKSGTLSVDDFLVLNFSTVASGSAKMEKLFNVVMDC